MTPRHAAGRRHPAAAPTAAIRHCPLCGVAMQASKSRPELAHFDTFACQTCHTTIVETPRAAPPPPAK